MNIPTMDQLMQRNQELELALVAIMQERDRWKALAESKNDWPDRERVASPGAKTNG